MAVWAADFEFVAPAGELVAPRCMVAIEVRSGRRLRLWEDELHTLSAAPFPVDGSTIFVAYMAAAELSCFRALGWPYPMLVLDLYVEFLLRTNGTARQCGTGLLGALAYFGLPGIEAGEKATYRDLVIRGGPYTEEEQVGILDYCESDVQALLRLLPHLEP
jgi:hypothetical protein